MPPKGSVKRKRVEEIAEEEESVNNSGEEDDNDEEGGNQEEDDDNDDDNDDDDDDNEDENGAGDSDSDGNEDDDDNDNDGDEDNNDDDDDDDYEDEVSEPPAKKGRKEAAKAAPAAKGKATKAAAKNKATKKATKSSAKSKKTAKKAKKTEKAGKKLKKSTAKDGEARVGKIKSMKKFDRLEEARRAYKWWEAPKLPQGINWRYLEHPGVVFAPPYIPHGVPLYYDGNPVKLTPEQEEVATFYAAMPLDGPQLGNPATASVFQKNFFHDFRELLGEGHVVKKFEKCNFDHIREHINLQKSLKKAATDEEKLIKKETMDAAKLKHGYALIDGRVEKVYERARCMCLDHRI